MSVSGCFVENAIRPTALGKNYVKNAVMRRSHTQVTVVRASMPGAGRSSALHNHSASKKASGRGYYALRRVETGGGFEFAQHLRPHFEIGINVIVCCDWAFVAEP